MKLEVGKTYIDGYGREVTIISDYGPDKYPFIGNNYMIYTNQGSYGQNWKSRHCLVKEKETNPTMKIETTRTLKDGLYPQIEITDGAIFVNNLLTKEDIKQAIESLQACLEALE